jgi:hypothetical protein
LILFYFIHFRGGHEEHEEDEDHEEGKGEMKKKVPPFLLHSFSPFVTFSSLRVLRILLWRFSIVESGGTP